MYGTACKMRSELAFKVVIIDKERKKYRIMLKGGKLFQGFHFVRWNFQNSRMIFNLEMLGGGRLADGGAD
ncbi:hypothetical protein D7V82_08330 [bacterium 1xD8-6]|jgi:hypothetical protein|nr:hypothetical protein D7V72_10615 [bacterium D16-36]RKI69980.1 hypothetical protein D7V82_08330 [bacterium 1xD8-6]